MPTWAWIVIVVVAALIVLGAIAAWTQQRKRSQLKERLGSEYDRTVSERGERMAAEKELAERERKREQLDIVPLSPDAQKRYSASWQQVQGQFVDDPSNAVNEADRLVTDAMRDLSSTSCPFPRTRRRGTPRPGSRCKGSSSTTRPTR